MLCQVLRAVPDKVTPAQLQRVDGLIKKTTEDDPDSVALRLKQAAFFEIADAAMTVAEAAAIDDDAPSRRSSP